MERIRLNKSIREIFESIGNDKLQNDSLNKPTLAADAQLNMYVVGVTMDGQICITFNPEFKNIVSQQELTDKFGKQFNKINAFNVEVVRYLQEKTANVTENYAKQSSNSGYTPGSDQKQLMLDRLYLERQNPKKVSLISKLLKLIKK